MTVVYYQKHICILLIDDIIIDPRGYKFGLYIFTTIAPDEDRQGEKNRLHSRLCCTPQHQDDTFGAQTATKFGPKININCPTFKRSDLDVGYECVEFVWGVFIFVPTTGQSNSYSERNIPLKFEKDMCYVLAGAFVSAANTGNN